MLCSISIQRLSELESDLGEEKERTDFLWYVRVAMVFALMERMSQSLTVLSCEPVITFITQAHTLHKPCQQDSKAGEREEMHAGHHFLHAN